MRNMNTEAHSGPRPEPASATNPEARTRFVADFREWRQIDPKHADIVLNVVEQRVSDPNADTMPIPIVESPTEIDSDDTDTYVGRHRSGVDHIGRHVTRGERDARLNSRIPAALGRLAYAVAAGLDRRLNERRDRRAMRNMDDEPTMPDDDTLTSEEQAPEEAAPLTFEQRVRAAEADRTQSSLEATERKRSRLQRIRNTIGAVAASAALVAATSSIMRSPDSVDALKEMTAKGTGKTLVVGEGTHTANKNISRHDRGQDDKTSEPTPHTEDLSDDETSLWSEAMKVDQAEGLFSTFKQMNIPEEKWDMLMHKVGPKLEDMDEAYYDSTTHEYRLKGDGSIKRAGVKLIAETARKIKV